MLLRLLPASGFIVFACFCIKIAQTRAVVVLGCVGPLLWRSLFLLGCRYGNLRFMNPTMKMIPLNVWRLCFFPCGMERKRKHGLLLGDFGFRTSEFAIITVISMFTFVCRVTFFCRFARHGPRTSRQTYPVKNFEISRNITLSTSCTEFCILFAACLARLYVVVLLCQNAFRSTMVHKHVKGFIYKHARDLYTCWRSIPFFNVHFDVSNSWGQPSGTSPPTAVHELAHKPVY